MRRLLLIANPSASGFTGAALRDVEGVLGESYAVTTAWPNGPAESRQAAADAAADGYAVVAAMGGDGVVHHVANGLAFTDTALGVIPTGTTNVVARILGIPMKPRKAAAAIITGQSRPMTLAHIATEDEMAARSEYAVFALGMGLDADVVAVSDQRPAAKYYFSSVNFATIATKRVLSDYRTKLPNMSIECDGRKAHASTVLVQIHDMYTYWGRVPLSLTSDTGDGITAIALERVSINSAVGLVTRGLLRRSTDSQRGVHVFRDLERLTVYAEPPAQFQADGELLGTTDSVEITPAYDALVVIAPRA